MSNIVKTDKQIFSAEIGKPINIELELDKTYKSVNVSIGCNIKTDYNEERRVYIYEDFVDADKINLFSEIEPDAPTTYNGKLVNIEWFMHIEAEETSQKFGFEVYSLNYNKYQDTGK